MLKCFYALLPNKTLTILKVLLQSYGSKNNNSNKTFAYYHTDRELKNVILYITLRNEIEDNSKNAIKSCFIK